MTGTRKSQQMTGKGSQSLIIAAQMAAWKLVRFTHFMLTETPSVKAEHALSVTQ